MTTTPNLGLNIYSEASGSATTFLNFRLATAGNSSNFTILDTFAGQTSASTASLAGRAISYVNASQISANYYEATTANITSYATESTIKLKANASNTGAVTLKINSLAVVGLKKVDSSGNIIDLVTGDLILNQYYLCSYNGTYYVMISTGTSGSSTVSSGSSGSSLSSENVLLTDSNTFYSGPITSLIATDGFTDTYPNPIGWRNGGITSIKYNEKEYQLYAYYNTSGSVTIATRQIPGKWSTYNTGIDFVPAGDGHNYISVGLDLNGYIHICYDMHGDSLHYRRSTVPIDQFTGNLTSVLSMLGTNEDYVTYPGFFNDYTGNLYFTFRHDTGSIPHQYGDTYFYQYNHNTQAWSAPTGTGSGGIIIDATSTTDLSYHIAPAFDFNGNLHFFWTICIQPGSTYSNIYYMYWNRSTFKKAGGASQTIPATVGNATSVDALSGDTAQPSVLNQCVSVDGNGYPHITYHREDGDSYFYLYHLWYNGSSWVKMKLSDVPRIADTGQGIWSILAIDKVSNIAHSVYTDAAEGNTNIYMMLSKPNDFTSWNKFNIYPHTTDNSGSGVYQPKYDTNLWEKHKKLSIPIEYWPGLGETSASLLLLDFIPSGWSLYDSLNYASLHANDIDVSKLSIHHTIGSGSAQAASGSSVVNYSGNAPIGISGSNISHNTSGVTPGTYLSANLIVDSTGHITSASSGASASSVGAPSNSPFITSASSSNLTNNLILTAGSNITITSASYGGGQIIINSLSSAVDYINIQDQKPSGTNGGTFTSGAWRTRDLNVEVSDSGSHASISSNQITLQSGIYEFSVIAPCYSVGFQQARLYNITDSGSIAMGMGGYSDIETPPRYPADVRSFIKGKFSISGSKVLEVQHMCDSTGTTTGFGHPCGFGTEIFTIVEFWKTG